MHYRIFTGLFSPILKILFFSRGYNNFCIADCESSIAKDFPMPEEAPVIQTILLEKLHSLVLFLNHNIPNFTTRNSIFGMTSKT